MRQGVPESEERHRQQTVRSNSFGNGPLQDILQISRCRGIDPQESDTTASSEKMLIGKKNFPSGSATVTLMSPKVEGRTFQEQPPFVFLGFAGFPRPGAPASLNGLT
jgi:hypothetical protein